MKACHITVNGEPRQSMSLGHGHWNPVDDPFFNNVWAESRAKKFAKEGPVVLQWIDGTEKPIPRSY
jgi:hypothetical protein